MFWIRPFVNPSLLSTLVSFDTPRVLLLEYQKPKGEHRRQDWLTLKGTEYQHSISQGPTAP
jgi:hypothetical protein